MKISLMNGYLDDNRILEIAATPYPSTDMEAYTIAKNFRSALEPLLKPLYMKR
jgi:hypothetical protein